MDIFISLHYDLLYSTVLDLKVTVTCCLKKAVDLKSGKSITNRRVTCPSGSNQAVFTVLCDCGVIIAPL